MLETHGEIDEKPLKNYAKKGNFIFKENTKQSQKFAFENIVYILSKNIMRKFLFFKVFFCQFLNEFLVFFTTGFSAQIPMN